MIKRILIVGNGSIGQRHLRLARVFFPKADIRILKHRRINRIPEYSNGYFSTIEDAIRFSPEIAVIANPAPFHISVALVLAKIGVHLLIEKPLSTSSKDIKKLFTLCQKNKVVLLTGYNLRFLKSLQYFNKILSESIVGEVFSVRCETGYFLPEWRPDSDYRETVSALSDLGGGVLFELSHEIDYLRWIFGEVAWVQAVLSHQSNLEINVEDCAHLILGFTPSKNEKNLIATVNLDFIRHDNTRLCEVIGEKGTLRWNGITGEVSIYKSTSKDWQALCHLDQQSDDSYIDEWKDFISCIDEGRLPFISGEDGLKVVEIIEAAKKSSKLHSRVLVNNEKGIKG